MEQHVYIVTMVTNDMREMRSKQEHRMQYQRSSIRGFHST